MRAGLKRARQFAGTVKPDVEIPLWQLVFGLAQRPTKLIGPATFWVDRDDNGLPAFFIRGSMIIPMNRVE